MRKLAVLIPLLLAGCPLQHDSDCKENGHWRFFEGDRVEYAGTDWFVSETRLCQMVIYRMEWDDKPRIELLRMDNPYVRPLTQE